MTKKRSRKNGKDPTQPVLEVVPHPGNGVIVPRDRRYFAPKTPAKALKEISRVYTEARRGQLDPADASKFAFILRTASDIGEVALLQPQIEELTARVNAIAKRVLG